MVVTVIMMLISSERPFVWRWKRAVDDGQGDRGDRE